MVMTDHSCRQLSCLSGAINVVIPLTGQTPLHIAGLTASACLMDPTFENKVVLSEISLWPIAGAHKSALKACVALLEQLVYLLYCDQQQLLNESY